MKIYDCFTFYNEFELLELRLKSLWDVVDYFVVVEGSLKHTGEPKIINFWTRVDEFREFLPKIRFVPADLSSVPFKGTGDWSLEFAQRNAIMSGLADAQPDDLIMISDLDEIPVPDVLRKLLADDVQLLGFHPTQVGENTVFVPAQLLVPASTFLDVGAIVLMMAFHYYYFDWVSKDGWPGTSILKRKNLTMPQEIRDARGNFPRLLEAGHHFSYMGGADRVMEKMTSIVDGNEFVQSDKSLLDRKRVERAMASGTDIYGRQGRSESQFLPYDARNIRLPHLEEFLHKYPHFLREPEKYFGNRRY